MQMWLAQHASWMIPEDAGDKAVMIVVSGTNCDEGAVECGRGILTRRGGGVLVMYYVYATLRVARGRVVNHSHMTPRVTERDTFITHSDNAVAPKLTEVCFENKQSLLCAFIQGGNFRSRNREVRAIDITLKNRHIFQ